MPALASQSRIAYVYAMIRGLETSSGADDLMRDVARASTSDDGHVAQTHLAMGHPVYFSEAGTPAGMVVKAYPDGHRELVRFDGAGEASIQAAA